MSDIVERLRMDADNNSDYVLTADDTLSAAAEIEALRQRVKELEAEVTAPTPSSLSALPAGWQRVIEAAKFAIFCPDAGGYKDGRSVEDCYEELEAAVNAYYGTDIRAVDLDWITEGELEAMIAAAPKESQQVAPEKKPTKQERQGYNDWRNP